MKNKTVIVTGGSSGIGLVTARRLAEQGAQVVIISRNGERCQAAAESIRQSTGNPNIEFIAADLSSLKEIHRAADEFKARHSKLHVLVNNAGAFVQSFQASADGYEMSFALNHLSYYVLTLRLIDLLKATAATDGEARIVNVSSDAHQIVQKLDFERFPRQSGAGFVAYGESKFMNILFTYELAERLEGTGVTVNALHPGFVRSGFGKNNHWIVKIAMNLSQLFAITPEKGADSSVYLASSPEVKGITGQYFVSKKSKKSSTASYDRDSWQQLWQRSEQLTGVTLS